MKHILIVDDDTEFCKEMKSLLEVNNFRADYETDGWKAVSMARNGVDLILFDLRLTLLSGFYFIALLKSYGKTKQIPIFAVTALLDDESKKRAKFLGVDEYFIKPVDYDLLVGKINEHLNLKQLNVKDNIDSGSDNLNSK